MPVTAGGDYMPKRAVVVMFESMTRREISSRALRLSGLRALRILARSDRKLLQLHDLIANRQQGLVLATPLPLLDFVHRLEAENNNALGRFASKARDLTATHDKAATAVFDALGLAESS